MDRCGRRVRAAVDRLHLTPELRRHEVQTGTGAGGEQPRPQERGSLGAAALSAGPTSGKGAVATAAVSSNRHRGVTRLPPLVSALLVAIAWMLTAVEGAAQTADTTALEDCARTPTSQCVVALAIDTAEAIDDAHVRANSFVLIAEAQRVAGDLPGARESLSQATASAASSEDLADLKKPARARTFIDIARAQIAIGDEVGARRTLLRTLAAIDKIEDPHARAEILRDISAAQRLAGDEEGARKTLSLALAAADQIESDDSKLGMLSAIAEAHGSAGELQRAAEIVLKAREIYARIGPASDYGSSVDLRCLVAAQVEAGDIEGALRTAQVIGDKDDYGRARALADIASALAAAGDVAGAFATEEHIRGAFLRIVVVTHVGVALAEAGDIAGATRAAARITEINEEEIWGPAYTEATIYRSFIFGAIVDAHIAAGAFDQALGALEKIERSYQIANAAVAIAEAQIAAGDLDAARAATDTVCEFRRRNDRCVEALSALAAAHASAGNIEQARALVSLAWEESEWTRYCPERIRAIVALWKAQMGMGDVQGGRKAFAEALAVARSIDTDSERVEELPALGGAAAQMGEHESAAQAFSQAMEAAGDIEDSSGHTAVKRANAFKNISNKRAQAGDWRGAQEAFSRALLNAARLTDDDHWRVLLFRAIASAMASARQEMPVPANDE